MFIPGFLIGWLTFPGVIVHELGHLLLCKLAGVSVSEYKLFSFVTDGPLGYVVYNTPNSVFKNFLITFGPFFVNSVVSFVLMVLAFSFGDQNLIFFGLAYLGISVGMHAFPSKGDADALLHATLLSLKQGKIWNVVFLPFVLLIYLGVVLSIIWADLIYALIIVGFAMTFVTTGLVLPSEGYQFSQSYVEYNDEYASFQYPDWTPDSSDDSVEVKVSLSTERGDMFLVRADDSEGESLSFDFNSLYLNLLSYSIPGTSISPFSDLVKEYHESVFYETVFSAFQVDGTPGFGDIVPDTGRLITTECGPKWYIAILSNNPEVAEVYMQSFECLAAKTVVETNTSDEPDPFEKIRGLRS